MPRGPKGEKRPADVIGGAVMVARISIGEIEDTKGAAPNRAKGGKAGGAARAAILPSSRRADIAQRAAKARWNRDSEK